MNRPPDAVLTLQQVAEYLKVHPNTIYRLARRGKLPAFKIGSDWRFNRESVDQWRLAQERPASAEPRGPDDMLGVVYSLVGETTTLTVTLDDLGRFLGELPKELEPRVNQLVQSNFLAKVEGGPRPRYRVTSLGASRARQNLALKGHASLVEFERRHSTLLKAELASAESPK
jgi:excisionase family DNA binding protein